MNQHWKPVLYAYVRARNQIGIHYSTESLLPLKIAGDYITKQQKILEDMQRNHHLRGRKPKRNETRIKTLKFRENEHEVIANIGLKIKAFYMQQNKEYCEERIEHECITLIFRNEEWIISNIEMPRQDEPYSPHSNALINIEKNTKSIPYLNEQLISKYEGTTRRIKYDRSQAKHYADTWWDQPNPEYIHFDVDCTNYVSQCLYAGRAPMNYTGKRDKGWWYRDDNHQERWSFSWSVSHSLYWLLTSNTNGLTAELVQSAEQLSIGDVIIYDWEGDSNYQHSVIVTAMDSNGMPLVNAHTANSKHRYWDYRDSYAWSEKTKYRFFHISDYF